MNISVTDFPTQDELRSATDEQIDDAVKYASPMVLRGLLYQLTGNEALAALPMGKEMVGFFEVPTPASEEGLNLIRAEASAFLKRHRDAGGGEIDLGPKERLPRSLRLMLGDELSDEDVKLWVEELALDPCERALKWSATPTPEQLEDFSVIVIGAGMGGLNAAVQLKRAGIKFTVIDKNAEVGGTWYENRYPGARVDSPSRSYTHIFGVDFGYPSPFCEWQENERYFNWVADNFEVRDKIIFNTEIRKMVWDEAAAMWEIHGDGPDGEKVWRANAVLTSVGFLNRPRLPEFEGMLDFEGTSFHTARWPEDLDIAGKRIAIIGTGCTGYQTIPELALKAEHVTVFQRTPQWLFAMPGYRSPFPPQVNWLDRNLPLHTNFMRALTSYSVKSFCDNSEIDPNFDDPHTRSASNKRYRDACVAFVEEKLGKTKPELVEKMIPPHPPFSARPVMVDPEYSILDALARDNVTLVSDGVRRITPKGIEAADGTEYAADIIVYATGFHATEYLFPMEIIGRDGVGINELWAHEGARAYVGCMMPGFPNLWSIYGPNTNGALNVAGFHELVTLHALQCIERLILDDKRSIEVSQDAYLRYNAVVDERNNRKVWSDHRAKNYYWTQYGRSAVMCPFHPEEMWRYLRYPKFDELDVR